MQTFWAVVCDLYSFVFRDWCGFRVQKIVKRGAIEILSSTKKTPRVPLLPLPPEIPTQTKKQSLTTATGTVYVSRVSAALHAFPTETFDGVILKLPYGTPLQSLSKSGRWHEVCYAGQNGWVLREAVESSAGDIFPPLVSGGQYVDTHVVTKKIRLYIEDVFSAGALSLSLQDTEFCLFKLLRKGRYIDWPLERPRMAGRWQIILKKISGIRMSVIPKSDSIIEVVKENGVGHVAYVEAVFPDQSILVSSVGFEHEGEYQEMSLTKETWREMRPIFIEVN